MIPWLGSGCSGPPQSGPASELARTVAMVLSEMFVNGPLLRLANLLVTRSKCLQLLGPSMLAVRAMG